ncbi:MAG: hypothetical protein EA376_01050 [Phycisphaeraceae bacterium]|nr:MAG: hypothetical protein EA376_01050 [Phycisphaeraceae bacterium]
MARNMLIGAAFAAAIAIAPDAGAERLTIADFAPPETMLLISMNDWSALEDGMERSGLRAMMDTPELQRWLRYMSEEGDFDWRKAMEDIGVDPDDVGFPEGMAGAAAWFDVDPDRRRFGIRWMAVAEYGDQAAMMEEIALDMIDRAERDGRLELDETEIADVRIHTIEFAEIEEEANEWADEWRDWEGPTPFVGRGGMLDPNRFHMARVGGKLIMAGDLEAMERAIDAAGGERLRTIAGEAAFGAADRLVGDAQASLMIFAPRLLDMMTRMYEDAGEFDMIRFVFPTPPAPLFGALGLTDINSVSFGARLGEGGHVGEVTMSMLTSGKQGLLSLMDTTPAAPAPAPFIGADAASVNAFRIDFPRILQVVQRVVASLPAEERMQAQAGVGMAAAAVEPLLRNIGPEVYVWSVIRRPFAHDSRRMMSAVRLREPQILTDLLAQWGPMIGMQARDFDGLQIWESQGFGGPGMGMPAIGVGAGHAFIGMRDGVEEALRAAGRPDALRLADEERVRRALGVLGDRNVAFSWSETRQRIEYAMWSARNARAIFREQMREVMADLDPEVRDEMLEDWDEAFRAQEQIAEQLPSAEVFSRFLGDVVSEVRPMDNGYIWRTIMLKPE